MLLDELTKMITEDSVIDKNNLDIESLKIAQLHSKYYVILIEELKVMKALEFKLTFLLKEKSEYYSGKSSDETYKENPLFHKILKQDLDLYLKSDKDITKIEAQKFEQKIKIEFLENFIKTINNRSFNIGNAISFIKFKNGIN